ncbi:hypothetical protein F2P81_017867 [Scophthalmus maximus]|uniref:SH3 and multiple ankyrin repeat domains protein 3-like n=1 Tax=Scophthalmus maximus TaxID=52904 RepID=A0A6A4SDY5_SCOMX|nr:hypothetical protein F2P81_017867 [Scophthalmus maximus]
MPLSPAADTKHDRPRQQAVSNGNPTGSAVARDDEADDTPPGNSTVVRIGIPDLQQTKCLRLDPELPVWTSKQRVLVTLTQSLSDVLNYGLFQPAFNGRAGKFLDEERLLKDYPLPPITPIPYLEFRYKRRVYTQTYVDDKQLAKLHTKLEESCELIKVLRCGGAHLDFRTRDGITALHRAVLCRNSAALTTLLDLGASPDYKDSRGLTPLYHSAMVGGAPYCCELLLQDHATIGQLCQSASVQRSQQGHQELQQPDGLSVCLFLCVSDYVIEEKTAVLQKRESEGFGFVLRGAKAETPIEEFAPTPAFPALQYLESVDQGGVAWRAGLRTGDFLIEVVSLIRQGGSRLLMKVVSVSRKSESNLIRKKGVCVVDLCSVCSPEETLRETGRDVGRRSAGSRPEGSSVRRLQSGDGQTATDQPANHTGRDQRTPEDDRISALIHESRFPRSSSLTDSFIPPPPQTAPPPPPSGSSSASSLFLLDSGPPPSFLPPPPPARGEGLTRSSFKPGAEPRLQELSDSPARSHAHAERQRKARSMIILQDTPPPPPLQPDAHAAAATTHALHTATHTATHTLHTATHTSTLSLHSTSPALGHSPLSRRRGRPIENPYANVGQQAPPTKPQRRKSPLLKQLPVEEQGLLDPSKSDGGGPGSPSRAEMYQQQVLSERARVQGRRSSLFLSVEGAGSENQVPPLLTLSHSMDDLGELPPPAPVLSPSPTPHTFLHPLTGKPLDPSSPLALALAARERALTARTPSPEPRSKHASASTTPIPTPAASPEGRHKRTPLPTPQSSPEPRSKRTTPQMSPEPRTKRTTPQTSPELRHKRITPPLFPDGQVERPETEGGVTSPAAPSPERWRPSLPPLANESHSALIDRRRSLTVGSSEEEGGAYTVTLPPALLSSSDEETREELRRIGLVAPPPAFASSAAPPLPSSLTLLPRRAGEGGGESGPDSLGRQGDEEEGGDERLHDSSSSPSSLPPSITLASPPAPSSPSSPTAAHPSSSSVSTSPSALKPRLRSPIGRGRSSLRDPLLKQSSDSELLPSAASSSSPSSPLCSSPTSGRQPRYLFQRRSKLWGGGDEERRGLSPEEGGGRPAALGGQGSASAVDLSSRSASVLELSGRGGSGLDLANRLQLLNKDSHSLGEEPSPLDPGRRSPVGGARSIGHPSSTSPCSERPDLSSGRGLTILKSSSLSLPSEPKEVRFVMRSASARTRSRSPSPSPHASPCPSPVLSGPLLALRPWRQRPLNLWNKYDVGDWLESVGLAEHRQRFQEHEIEGSHLPALTKEDYVELGVTRLGHRINIERALRQLLDGST